MKILHVIPSVSVVHGGPSKAVELMERILQREGVTVETVTTDDDGPGRHVIKSIGVPLLENGVRRWYFRKQFEIYKVSFGLAAWLYRNAKRYDVIHIHALFSFSSLAAAFAAKRTGVPYVMRPLGTLTRYGIMQRRPWAKKLSLALLEGPALRSAAAVHFTSEDEAREASELGIAMRSVVIPIGIEAGPMADGEVFNARFPQLRGLPFILFLSRLDPKKNVEGLLRAFKLVIGQHSNLRLVIAGGGDAAFTSSLVALSQELGLSHAVTWVGHLEGEVKAGAFHLAKAFVLPSFSENFGIAAAEALLAGLPCVLGRGVALAREVEEAGAGLSVEPAAEAIAGGILALLANEEARITMKSKASALASEKYSVQAMGQSLKNLYSGILAQ